MTTIIGNAIGWGLAAICVWFIAAALIDIHRSLGFGSKRGFFWALAVTFGSVFGSFFTDIFVSLQSAFASRFFVRDETSFG